jgi:MoaD family protein
MQILFFGSLRGITGEKEIRWTTPTPILGDLLCELSAHYGAAFERWVLKEKELGDSVLIQINGHDARHEGGISAPLKPDDVIAIFPAIAGG